MPRSRARVPKAVRRLGEEKGFMVSGWGADGAGVSMLGRSLDGTLLVSSVRPTGENESGG